MVAPAKYDWDHNPASILDTIDLHLTFRAATRSDPTRGKAIAELAGKLSISVPAATQAVDSVRIVDPKIKGTGRKCSIALRILWNLYPKSSGTPSPLPRLNPMAKELIVKIQDALDFLRTCSEGSVPEQGAREELVALLRDLFVIDESKADGVAARLLDRSSSAISRT